MTYDLIYCDPPWEYETESVTVRHVNHYSTMSMEELKRLQYGNCLLKTLYWRCGTRDP